MTGDASRPLSSDSSPPHSSRPVSAARPTPPSPSASTPFPAPAPRAAAAATQPRNPLHGLTLEAVVTALVAHYGWAGLAERIALRCFSVQPSMASSLKVLRKTPWARDKVESLYLFMLREQSRQTPRVPAPVPAPSPPAALPSSRPPDPA